MKRYQMMTLFQGAVQQAIGEQLHFNVMANVYTFFAVTGVILFCAPAVCGCGCQHTLRTQGEASGHCGTHSWAALCLATPRALDWG